MRACYLYKSLEIHKGATPKSTDFTCTHVEQGRVCRTAANDLIKCKNMLSPKKSRSYQK